MAEIKIETTEDNNFHRELSDRTIAEAEERIRTQGLSRLGRELMAILDQADAEGIEPWTTEEIDQYINEARRRPPWQ